MAMGRFFNYTFLDIHFPFQLKFPEQCQVGQLVDKGGNFFIFQEMVEYNHRFVFLYLPSLEETLPCFFILGHMYKTRFP